MGKHCIPPMAEAQGTHHREQPAIAFIGHLRGRDFGHRFTFILRAVLQRESRRLIGAGRA